MTSQTRAQIRNFLVDLLISVLFSWITTYRISGDAAFVVGFLVFIAAQLVRLHLSNAALENKTDVILSYISTLSRSDLFAELRTLYNFRHVGILTEHMITVDAHDHLVLWRDIVARISTSWVALQYAKAADAWELGWGKTSGHFIQEERIKSGCTIERIILFDNTDDRSTWKEVADMQREIGVRISFASKQDLLRNKALVGRTRKLNTFDVAVADNRWVFLIQLDGSRNVLGACFTDDEKLLEEARFLINEARTLAQPD
jgi:hypothetical protein